MSQLLLLFRCTEVPPRHIEWLQIANAGEYLEKKRWFYPFKTRFLRQFALSDGLDLQVIVKKCWCGDGIWRGGEYADLPETHWERCYRCGGTGIYDTKRIALIRWMIGGMVFHEPSDLRSDIGLNYKNTFNGLIKHSGVSAVGARQAMEKLLLRYEPKAFNDLWMGRWREWRYLNVQKAKWQVARVKRLLSFWKPEQDELSF